jgi:hypothetical protein
MERFPAHLHTYDSQIETAPGRDDLCFLDPLRFNTARRIPAWENSSANGIFPMLIQTIVFAVLVVQ